MRSYPASPPSPRPAPSVRRLSLEALLAGVLLTLGAGCSILEPAPVSYDRVVLESGVAIRDLVVPEEGRRAVLGDRVAIDYELALEDGEVVDSTLDRGRPATFRLGSGEVPAGVEEGILGMRQYGRRRIVVPPALGYGDEGLPPLVPPGATLRFEVELMELEGGEEQSGPE